jgi:acetyltransferase-like isoleucine patch superfamily enzyme
MQAQEFRELFLGMIDNRENPYHPLVWMNGTPEIGAGCKIGFFTEVFAKGARLVIGEGCDIGSFVAINVADSHRRCIGLSETIAYREIIIGDRVFVGSHCVILGGVVIGHHSVIAAGSIVRPVTIPPFSLVVGDQVRPEYYRAQWEQQHPTGAR